MPTPEAVERIQAAAEAQIRLEFATGVSMPPGEALGLVAAWKRYRGDVPVVLCRMVHDAYRPRGLAFDGTSWRCGLMVDVLLTMLRAAGVEHAVAVRRTVRGVEHIYVECGDWVLDPSIAQFGDFQIAARGAHPVTGQPITKAAPNGRRAP